MSYSKILIVDDEPRICDSLKALFGNEEYEIQTRYSGQEAIEALVKDDFDLVLLDLVLPDINGAEILDHLNRQTPETLVIVITGHASLDSAIESLKRGAFDYVRKPFEHEELSKAVKNALKQKGLRSGRVRAEEALKESEERYRALFEGAAEGILVADVETRKLKYANPGICVMLGYSEEELKQLRVDDLHPKESLEYVISEFKAQARGEKILASNTPCLRKDRKIIYADINATKLPIDGIECNVGFFTDITARRRSENRLNRINDCFLSLGSDPIENINLLTRMCGELLGGSSALYNRFEGKLLHSLGQWNTPPDYNPKDKPQGHICFDLIQKGRDEVVVIRDLPNTPYAETDSNVIRYNLQTYIGKPVKSHGELVGSLCVVFQTDIVLNEDDKKILEIAASAIGVEEERKRAEEALQKANDELERRVEERTAELSAANELLKREVAERREAEEAVRKSEEKYKTLIESSLTGIFIHQDGKYVFVNDRFAEIHGCEPGALLGKQYLTLIHPDERKAAGKMASRRLKGEDIVQQYEIRRIGKDGKTIWCEMMATLIEYEGRPAIMGNIIDITERKAAEEALRDSEERYRKVLEGCPDPVVVYDVEDKAVYINPAFTRVFGWTPREFLGIKTDYVPDENWPETQMMIDTVRAGQSFSGFQSRRRTKEGRILDVSISVAIYTNRDGIPVGSVYILRDITDEKRAQEALQAREAELEEQSHYLEEVNTTLKVLLKQREKDKKEVGENIVSNMKALVSSYVEELKATRLDARQKTLVSVLESNLDNIVSPLVRQLSFKFSNLTAMEMRVANLVKVGKTNKEMAEILYISENTILSHRYHLRTKLGLKNKKINLRSHLLSLEM